MYSWATISRPLLALYTAANNDYGIAKIVEAMRECFADTQSTADDENYVRRQLL